MSNRVTGRYGVVVLGLGVAGAVVAGPVLAAPAPAFVPVYMEQGSQRLEFEWNPDVEKQWQLLLPRSHALVLGAERVMRVSLADVQRRQAQLRAGAASTSGGVEGGVWARVGGQFAGSTVEQVSTGPLVRAIHDLDPAGPLATAGDLDAFTRAAMRQRLEDAWADRLDGQDWFEALTPEEQAEAVATAAAGEDRALRNFDYDEQISHFNVGVDFVGGRSTEGMWLWGGAIGYARLSQNFDDRESVGQATKIDGDTVNVGAYFSWVRGAMYLDAAFSYAWHSMDIDVPWMRLQPEGAMYEADGTGMGLQLEAGWRMALTDALHITPHLAAVWVQNDLETAELQRSDAQTHHGKTNRLDYGDPKSQRLGLGATLGHDWALGGRVLSGRFTARYWREAERDQETRLRVRGRQFDPAASSDPGRLAWIDLPSARSSEASGWVDLSLGADYGGADRGLTLDGSIDYLKGGDYDHIGITALMRYQW